MVFTKQDIEQLHKKLAQLSIKDTQFQQVTQIKNTSLITFVQDSRNVQTTMNSFIANVVSNADISKIPVHLAEFEDQPTLSKVLQELYNRTSNGGYGTNSFGVPHTFDGSIDTMTAYGYEYTSDSIKNVGNIINAITTTICTIKESISNFMVIAKNTEIQQLFNQNV